MRQSNVLCFVVFLAALVLTGCQASTQGPRTWLDAPLDGMEFDVQEPVSIMAHASDLSGVTRFEFYVDEKLIAVDAGSGGRLGKGDAGWVPPAAGIYYIHAKATNGAGSVGTDAISRIVVHDAQSVIVCCPVPRERSTETPTPTISPTVPRPSMDITVTPSLSPFTPCVNAATFLQDVTVPPGTALATNQTFDKIWRVLNNGTCAWDSNYRVDYVGGEAMTTQPEIVVPDTAQGATADLLVQMIAPAVPGQHYTQWRLRSTQQWFGPGLEVWINVVGSQPAPQPQPQCPGAPAIEFFSANPTTINAGEATTLSWGAVSNANSAVIDPDIGGVRTPGSTTVSPSTTRTYTLTATGCGGTTRRQVMVVVKAPPQPPPPPVCPGPPAISSFSANPTSIIYGQAATLSWGAVSNATSVAIDPGIGGVQTPGSTSVRPNQTTTYTLTASGCGGTVRRHVTVAVTAPLPIITVTPLDRFPPSISNVSVNRTSIPKAGCGGGQITVSATVTDNQSGVDRVVAQLGGDVPMGSVGGNVYRANLGPFNNAGQVTILIMAWDKAGNSAQANSSPVTVTDCVIK